MNKIDKTDTLEKVLSNRRFTVDYFQREYRWGQKQIEQMLDDFQGTFDEFYDPCSACLMPIRINLGFIFS